MKTSATSALAFTLRAALATALLTTGIARAEPRTGPSGMAPLPIPTPEPTPPQAYVQGPWYGQQIMLTDVAAVAALIAAIHLDQSDGTSQTPAAAKIGFYSFSALYSVGAPVIHGLHHNGGAAARSVMLRLFLPLGGGILGVALGGGGWGSVGGGLLGMGMGMTTAMVVDWSTAYERVPVMPSEAEASDAPPSPEAGDWSPIVAAGPGRASLGVVVHF